MNGGSASIEGRYRLRAVLGEGGMGTVWSAERASDGAEVAIKVLKDQGVEQTRRLLREARIAGRLQHDNVVRVDEILALGDDPPALVMERLHGETLRERLTRLRRLPLGEAARIVLDVAGALAAAHALGIVHRDLKPENVFLHVTSAPEAARTVVKVLDFGIAKIVGASEMHTGSMTRTGAVLGTPCYMAPEQVFGEGDLDARADIWALGVVLFECLAGERPFRGDNEGQVFKAIAMGDAPSLSATANGVSEPVVSLVDRMLSKARASRPSLDEVVATLVPLADEELPRVVIGAREPALALAPTVDAALLPARVDAVLTPGPFEIVNEPTGRLRARRVLGLGAVGALVAAGALAVLLIVLGRRSGAAHEEGPGAVTSADLRPAPSEILPTAPAAVSPALAVAASATTTATTTETSPPKRAPVRAAVPVGSGAPATRLPGGVRAENPY